MNLSVIKQIAKNEMGDRHSDPYNERGDKYAHGERVAALALRLRQIIFPNEGECDGLLTVAAWFHDVCNINRMANPAMLGAAQTKKLLAGHYTAEELEAICGIIAVHDDHKTENKTYSNAVRLHQDADYLDHFGTLDIWWLVGYTARHNKTINEAHDYLQNEWPDDIARLRGELHFGPSRKIFDEKTEYMKQFIERFSVESAGGIWHEDVLLGS
jgi:uncharacterized protein